MTTETLHPRHLEILEARGFDAELLVRLGVHSSDKLGGDCVVIPFIRNGVRVNRKFRTISGDKRFCQDAGAPKCFWNVDVIGDDTLADQPLVITEGEFDAMAAIQCGFARTVSVPDGAPPEAIGDNPNSAKYAFIENAPQALRDLREIILATDGDGAGNALMNDLALRLGKGRCKWVRYPVGCKDLNDALAKFGVRGVTETIARAQWIAVDGVYRMSELPPLQANKPHSTGIATFDQHYRMRLGDLCIVTGIPGHGKTTFVNEICCRAAELYGWHSTFASFEQMPQGDHRRALRTFFNKRRVISQTDEQIASADEWIDQNFAFIVPSEDDDVTLAWTLERCATAVIRYGSRIVVIDPWNEMDHVRPPDMSLTEYTGFAIKQFRKFARKYRVHLVVCAHPVKQRKTEDGVFAPPTLYDISDSAHWYNKADVGIVVHRVDEVRTIIRVAKSRYHDDIGVPGEISGTFNPEMARYTILEKPQSYPRGEQSA
jgi:twinkle protein